MMGIVVLAVSSCSKDTVKETHKGTPIDFRANVESMTKGTEATTYNLEGFSVTSISGIPEEGVNIAEQVPEFFFKDVPFTRIGDYFYSYPTYYWPEDDRLMWFLAYAPSKEEMGCDVKWGLTKQGSTNYELSWVYKGIRPATNIADQFDLVMGATFTNKSLSEQNGGTSITMQHVLSQIEIRAKSNNSSYKYQICGVRIANPVASCDYSAWNGQWTMHDEKAVYEDIYDTPVLLTTWAQSVINPESGNAILLPQALTAWSPETDPTNEAKGAYLSVKLRITDENDQVVFPTDGREYGWAAVPIGDRWDKGDKYIYTLDFTNGAGYIDPLEPNNPGKSVLGDKIFVTSTLGAWEDKSSVEAKNSDLIGHWVGLKGNYIDSDDQIEHKYETAEEVEDWLGEFYDFIVPDDHTIKIKNAKGEYNTPTTFNVENNYVLMDCFRDGNGYQLKPYIQHIDENSAIIVNTFVYSSYTRVQTIYYKKSPLDE